MLTYTSLSYTHKALSAEFCQHPIFFPSTSYSIRLSPTRPSGGNRVASVHLSTPLPLTGVPSPVYILRSYSSFETRPRCQSPGAESALIYSASVCPDASSFLTVSLSPIHTCVCSNRRPQLRSAEVRITPFLHLTLLPPCLGRQRIHRQCRSF